MEPPLQLVSIERYPSFETHEDVALEFGTPDSNHYTPWPITLPTEEDPNEIPISLALRIWGIPEFGASDQKKPESDSVDRWAALYL